MAPSSRRKPTPRGRGRSLFHWVLAAHEAGALATTLFCATRAEPGAARATCGAGGRLSRSAANCALGSEPRLTPGNGDTLLGSEARPSCSQRPTGVWWPPLSSISQVTDIEAGLPEDTLLSEWLEETRLT